MTVNLDNYVEVHTRITKFYEKHPEGSLQSQWQIVTLGEQITIVVEARAYRNADDMRPGIGLASEPVPGKTQFTRDSELMNAETSAWGRAIAALGFEVHRGIASANEVRNRSGSADGGGGEATPKQKGAITRRCNDLAISDEQKRLLFAWAGGAPLTKQKASKLIELLKEAKDYADVWVRAGIPNPNGGSPDDLPVDVPDPVAEPPMTDDEFVT